MSRPDSVDQLPKWPWQKNVAKASLVELGQARTAKPWILNLIQCGHWITVALLFVLTWVLFNKNELLIERLGSRWQAFALLLWPMFQIQASMAPILMHARESWQLAPTAISTAYGNDALLRFHAYRFLFNGLSLSQLMISLAVYGINPLLIGIALPMVAIIVAGPSRPLLSFSKNDNNLLPISIPLAIAFMATAIISIFAIFTLYGPALSAANLPSILAPAPLLLYAAGGIVEVNLGETKFNQWWHLLAIATIGCGALITITFTSMLS